MSRLRRPLLPVTGWVFTAPKVHSGSWLQPSREIGTKRSLSRTKSPPIVSAVLELVGVETFTFAGNPANQ